jgi:hypothetical protein
MNEFKENEMFCIKCCLHDTFWSGGNSWGIDSCPKCGSQETILYKNMNFRQRVLARRLFDEWWKKKRITSNSMV